MIDEKSTDAAMRNVRAEFFDVASRLFVAFQQSKASASLPVTESAPIDAENAVQAAAIFCGHISRMFDEGHDEGAREFPGPGDRMRP